MKDLHLTMNEVQELPLAQGFALVAWCEENNGIAPVDRLGPGYVAQEVERIKQA